MITVCFLSCAASIGVRFTKPRINLSAACWSTRSFETRGSVAILRRGDEEWGAAVIRPRHVDDGASSPRQGGPPAPRRTARWHRRSPSPVVHLSATLQERIDEEQRAFVQRR